MGSSRFDFIIIGNGLAGLQMALAMSEDTFFDVKSIALIDPSEKKHNDKTWCFWEIGEGNWDHIISKTWSETIFVGEDNETSFSLAPYQYKMLRSINFYEYCIEKLKQKSNIHFLRDEVISVDNNIVITKDGIRLESADHIFDSRLPEAYSNNDDSYTRIFQHFKGWVIETEGENFNPEVFTTMDYRVKYQNDTTFTYVLPIAPNKALVEFTFFTPYLVEEEVYDLYLKKYISEVLQITNYTIDETEKGIIPMTNFPFHKYNTAHCTKIGTAGGWVKGSTGYSFKHTEKKIAQIIRNLKNDELPSKNLVNKKFRFYDSIFLSVLNDKNKKGEWIFNQFYTKNKTTTMFRFLDEESHFTEDLAIMKSLFSTAFLTSFLKTVFGTR